MNGPVAVDVVVDVPSSHVDGTFTYLTGRHSPRIGERVRIPFGRRIVSGWVVSSPKPIARGDEFKEIDGLEAGAESLDATAIGLADWLRRRFACTFREAIGAAGAHGAARSPRSAYMFVAAPAAGDAVALALYDRFKTKRFSAVSAHRALRGSGRKLQLETLLRDLERLVRARVLARAAAEQAGMAKPRRKRTAVPIETIPSNLGSTDARTLVPTADQIRAGDVIDAAVRSGNSTVLLHGVTGSGKTLVYARAIEKLRARGDRAIVLVPEISLTPQTAGRFSALYGTRVGVLHSGLSERERVRVWESARSGAIDVIVGARSAVFAQLPNLRLIVLDEEHESSYKQDVSPRYDTAAVARERMREARGAVVFGSATPSLESYWGARSGELLYVRMAERATNVPLPPVEIVDMTAVGAERRHRPLGPALVGAMEHALERREKVLLFVNRRGYAGLLLCRSCGFAPKCKRCAISLVVHAADSSMRCHVCGDAYKIASACPKCGSADLKPYGFGTQRVEEDVRNLFPDVGVVRMDSDTTATRGAHARLLDAFGSDAGVLIGTQMIAKGLDFPTVTVVGVVAADIDLNRPDFRAAERTFALLTQVAGRAGRSAPGARVVVQTYSPDHYAIRLAARHDYETFAEKELALRRELQYPPFGRLAYVAVSGVDAKEVAATATGLAASLRTAAERVTVLGPAPEPVAKARGEYRMRIALKTNDEEALLDACERAKLVKISQATRLTVVVDPR